MDGGAAVTEALLGVIAVLLLVLVLGVVVVVAVVARAFGSVSDAARAVRDFVVAAGGVVGFKIGGDKDGPNPEG